MRNGMTFIEWFKDRVFPGQFQRHGVVEIISNTLIKIDGITYERRTVNECNVGDLVDVTIYDSPRHGLTVTDIVILVPNI